MFVNGLVEEVERIRPRLGPTARMALGYQEVIEHLNGKFSLEEATQNAKNNTHRFVRRQMTWYRSLEGINWLEIPDGETTAETAGRVVDVYK